MIISAALICVFLAMIAFLVEAFRETGKIAFLPLGWALFMAAVLAGLR